MHLAAESSAALEFDKIRALIADRCVSLLGREEASALSPVAEISEIEARQRPVVEVVDLIRFDDPLSIRSLPDIRRSLQTSSVPGSSLGVRELLDVGEILRAAQTLATYLSNRADKYPAPSRSRSAGLWIHRLKR